MSQANRSENKRVALSYGMGVDSTSILTRWLTDPSSRDFDLADLIVITSQTGDEFKETGELVERYILPMLKAAGVRFVEIARAARSQKVAKYVVLQDTRSPERLHLQGGYTLADEMLESGTVPQTAGGHLCSIKSKAVPIEAWLLDEFGTDGRRHAIGYSADEYGRAKKDLRERDKRGMLDLEPRYELVLGYSAEETGRVDKAVRVRAEKAQAAAFFPLVDWGWDRQACLDEIEKQTGAAWPKSTCTFCPFSQGKGEILGRFQSRPSEALTGLLMETTARALNPNAGKLYKTKALLEVLEADGNTEALALLDAELESTTWALYRVRRMWSATKKAGKFNAGRSVEIVSKGSRDEVLAQLEELAEKKGLELEREGDVWRITVKDEEKAEGAQGEAFAIAPASATEKQGPTFKPELWREA